MNAPANIENAALSSFVLEQEILGAVLINNQTLEAIERVIDADDFSEVLHADLYETFLSIREAHGIITPALVIAAIGPRAQIPAIDCSPTAMGQYIANLAAAAATALQAVVYAKQIREFANRRRILAAAEIMWSSIQKNQPATDIAGAGIELLDEIAVQASSGTTPQVSMREADDHALAEIQHAMQNPGRLAGISSGLRDLDAKTSGLKRGELIVLAGRPGMGKSALAWSIARKTSSNGYPTFFSSLEMGAESLAKRGFADGAFEHGRPIPYFDIEKGNINEAQFRRVIDAARMQREWPLQIEPAAGLTVSQIAARVRSYSRKLERQGLRLGPVIVDHMHIVQPSNRYSGARVNEVSEISAALKGLAKELNVPVIALAQLNRALENRDDKRPTMADLRDSGSIEQDADAIIFVFREAYYLERETAPTPEKEMVRIDRLIDAKHKLEAIVAKQRNGPTGTVHLFCDIACNAVRDQEGI
jgi:replicative DNA helicase